MKTATVGAVRRVILDRPESLNALNSGQWTALLNELRAAEDDPSIRVLLLSGEGRMFCAGNDIKETSRFTTKGQARAYFLDLMVPTLAAMTTSRLPIVAAAQGMALGAGLELLQFCDVVVAAESCRFQLPETRIGLWATVFLGSATHSGHRRMSQYLALTGEPIDAETARDADLVTRVVPDADLESEALRHAHVIAGKAPKATAITKAYANHAMLHDALPVVRDALSHLIDRTIFGDEAVEGIASFVQKRSPIFD